MIPFSYNMVDMGGIDLAEANHTIVPGIYEKILEAINLCGDLILYNWKFADINIVPSAYTVIQQADSILINGLIQVTELDEVTVLGIEPPPPPIEPVEPLVVVQNGIYEAEPPVSGFNPVTVNIPIPDSDYFSTEAGDNLSGWYGSRTFRRTLQEGKLLARRLKFNSNYATGAFYTLHDYGDLSNVGYGDYAGKFELDISSVGLGYDWLYVYGGVNGAGNNGAANLAYADTSKPIISFYNGCGLYGPTNEPDFGNYFNSMPQSLKDKFWESMLETV